MKPIIVSPHAFERVHERRITRSEVESTLRGPDLKRTAKCGKLEAIKRFDHKELHVFYKETNSAMIFVTAYWRKP